MTLLFLSYCNIVVRAVSLGRAAVRPVALETSVQFVAAARVLALRERLREEVFYIIIHI